MPQVPGSLARALDALEDDHDFLRVGGVFGESLLASYIEAKREEIDTVRAAPAPHGVRAVLLHLSGSGPRR